MRHFFRRHRFSILALLLCLPCVWFALHSTALAQAPAPVPEGGVTSNEILPGEIGSELGTGNQDIRITIAKIVRVALGLLGTVALLLILYAGFVWMTAAGDDTKVESAKKTLAGAVIGLVIIMSAFAIVSFVLSGLLNATGGSNGADGSGGGSGNGGFGGGGAAGFRPTAIQPRGALAKYDVTAAVTFSTAPTDDISNIKANILLEKIAGNARTPVEYEPVVENNTIRLRPEAACPEPNTDRRCLEKNTDYQITVRAGLRNASASDPRAVSCGLGATCSQRFKTGDTVMTEPPASRISSPFDGQSVPAGDLVPIQSIATDQSGIASVDYTADDAFFASDGNVQQIAPSTYASQAVWDTSSLAPIRTVALRTHTFNIDGDDARSAPVRVTVRPRFCFNNIKDGDEAAVDCGGSCGACTGGACTQNNQCASGLCQNGQCVENPIVTDVQLRDGKPGNLITITGDHFGASGKVTFLGTTAEGDEKEAAAAPCAVAWTDERIVIAVPQGAVSGPIQVATSSGKKDATNDAFGPLINDFQVNETARPGICGVAPLSVKTGATVTVTGTAFGAAQGDARVQLTRAGADCSQIQDWTAAAESPKVSPWTDTLLQPVVPVVETGSESSNFLLRVVVGGQPSNSACLRIDPPEAGTEPRIETVTPEDGSVGTTLSLLGTNFGTGGTVRFRNAAGEAIGDIRFPAQCAASYWTSTGVTVKVPARFTTPADQPVQLGAYSVTIVRNDGRASNAVSFTINTDPVPPSLCRVDPDNGPVGTPVTLYGEGFGAIAAAELPAFTAAHPDAVRFHDQKNAASIGQWQSTTIVASVPVGAVTGPVRIRAFAGANASESNGVNFQVRDCREGGANACGAGRACCDDGACRAACGQGGVEGGFAWQFSTGPIPIFPIVVENATCQAAAPSVMPSPNPFKAATDICTDMGAMTARFSLPMDPATFTAANVVFESCGPGAAPLPNCAAVAGVGAPALLEYDNDGRSQLVLPVGGLKPSTWYRLTIRDQVRSLGTPERSAQPLDGNFDGRAGGAYVTSFKTGTGPCTISGVDVQPADALISASDELKAYQAFPLSSRCVILACVGRAVNWASSDAGKARVAPFVGARQCEAMVAPVAETEPGPPIQIRSTIDGITDAGTLTIDYANPRIVDYGPRDCTEACVNTVAFAHFNAAMAEDGAGSVLSNVRLYRCRNESCLAFQGEVPLAPRYNPASKLLTFDNVALATNTYYRAVILGTARSTSGASLTGLNYEGNAFSWIFRTRLNGDPCGPQSVLIEPAQTTLRYIGQVAPIAAMPISSPDKCAAGGQLLNASSYNWTWGKSQNPPAPEAFRFLPDVPPGTLLNTNPTLPAGCSSSCLLTGSRPPGTPSCGNGVLESGEACETPGANGCNANCLLTGNSEANGCGDGDVQEDRGEECDGGAQNSSAASGCTAACLLVGSAPGLSACGNGSVGVGEACDDGNTRDGDGCSSRCVLEGSRQNVYVCGNGVLEPGEACEYTLDAAGLARQLLLLGRAPTALAPTDERNPTRPNFACSQSCLVRGNPVVCTVGENCCGNGVIEPAKGENCDAGAENGRSSSGCSARCTKSGSDPDLRAFCGDTVLTVKPIDPLTGVQNGGGEECEAPSLDANIDPLQVVEARNQCDAKNACTAAVTAAIGQVSGRGAVSVECACRADSDCAAFGQNLSCGAGACCYPRPAAPVITPNADADVCRNAQITVTFGEAMNEGSLQGGLIVESCPAHAFNERGIRSWFARAVSAVTEFFRSLVGLEASAAHVCAPIEGAFKHVTRLHAGTPYTVSTFAPKQMFNPDRRYRVTVRGGASGVKTLKGVGYPEGGDTVEDFTTGPDVCRFDVVEMSPATELLQDASTVLAITATAMTDRGNQLEAIAPVQGVYDWTWSWSDIPENPAGGPLLDMIAAPGGGPSATVQAKKALNGQEQIIATAKVTTDTVQTPSTRGKEMTGSSRITIMLCQLPWPRRDALTGAWSPFVDPQTHYEFSYCRDNAGTPLPELKAQPIQGQSAGGQGLLRFCAATRDLNQPRACVTNADCNAGDSCQSKDLFLRFEDAWKLSDAIGLRVYNNAERLTPQEWYVSQHFSGKNQAVTVDGYQAVKDERTVYVGAADKYGDPDLRSYIYVFAFNDKADPRTAEVFNRLVGNVRFNTNMVASDRVTNVCKDGSGELVHPVGAPAGVIVCSSDLDCDRILPAGPAGMRCDADKDKIRRDMRRWQDLRVITEALEATRAQTGFYPKIESGSFVRGFTTSKWPSWSQQLGAAGTIVDPLNVFNDCAAFGSECAISRAACASNTDCTGGNGDVCKPVFEAETCYADKIGVFACPAHSHVYQYRAIGGAEYHLSADFEFDSLLWFGASCANKATELACEAALGCAWLPTGPASGSCEARITTAPVCAGLPAPAMPKRCLSTGAACAASNQCAPQDACMPNGVPLVGPAAGGVCGNGLLEGAEECEVGQTHTVACPSGAQALERCSAACEWQVQNACPILGADHCGNGALEAFAGETCDDGPQTGQYGRCRSGTVGCAKRCVNVTKRAPDDFLAARDILGTCTTNSDCASTPFESVCTDRHAFCGDGRKTGPEVCDDGARNGEYGFCAWDCRGPGPRCGDGTTNGAEECDANQITSPGVCIASGASLADGASAPSTHRACARNSDCAAGESCALCAPTPGGLPQTRTKGCFPATAPAPQACTFDAWGACKPSGACGNGIVEGAEECDAGAANAANGACLPTCRRNVCNDGFVRAGVEQCDNGAGNGVRCTPHYGATCNYCKNDCSIETISGAFCGDRTIQAPPESCDPGPVAAWCSRTYQTPGDPSGVKGCTTDNDCLPGVCRNYPGATSSTSRAPGNAFAHSDVEVPFYGPLGEAARRLASRIVSLAACQPGQCIGDTSGPQIGAITITPENPSTDENVTLTAVNVADGDSLVFKIEIFLTTAGVKTLKQTCDYNPLQLQATCAANVGMLPSGAHVVTVDARDGNGNLTSATRNFNVGVVGGDHADNGNDFYPIGTFEAYTTQGNMPPEGAPCRTSSDCAGGQYCQGGEGQCIAYNTQCRPEPYSNTQAVAAAKKCKLNGKLCSNDSECGVNGPCVPYRFDGSCNYCSNACVGTNARSAAFCGDGVKQSNFGEQCDSQGDPQATGHGTTYVCRNDCVYDPNGGFCGDNVIQNPFELCDTNSFVNGTAPSCNAQGAGTAGQVLCSKGCGYYTGGCDSGTLLPGDFRFKIKWPVPHAAANEVDLHVKAVYAAGPLSGQTKFFGWGSRGNNDARYVGNGRFATDFIQLFWDVTTNVHENDPEIMVLSTQALPAGTYYVYANAGTCFVDGNFSKPPQFDRNTGWWKGANAAVKNASIFTIEAGSPVGESGIASGATRALATVPNAAGSPCLWYIGRIDKVVGATQGVFTLKNVFVNRADGPNAND